MLFGIVTLSLTGVGTDAEDTVIAAECGVVQSAIDIYMAEQNVDTITAYTGVAREVVDTDDFAGFLRHLPTKYTYTWEDTGILTCAELP
ncbi:MAG: hypothetical protein U5K99_07355 [Anaerolineales bacterium]|nr:hypothetical protein [Anaerolineales bacterium]